MIKYDILLFPTVLNNTHESCYRSYHILKVVLEMVKRGDSKESIEEVSELLAMSDTNGIVYDTPKMTKDGWEINKIVKPEFPKDR